MQRRAKTYVGVLVVFAWASLAAVGCTDAMSDSEFVHPDPPASEVHGDPSRTVHQGVAKSGRYIPPPSVQQAGKAQAGNLNYYAAPKWEGGSQCSGTFRAGTKRLADFLVQNFKRISNYGGYSCRVNTADTSRMSVHGTGRAIDLFVPLDGGEADNTLGDPVANYLIEHATELGVQFFIWDRTDWNIERGENTPYGGPHPHHDHLHIELVPEAANDTNRQFPPPGGGSSGSGGSMQVDMRKAPHRVDAGSSAEIGDLLPGERAEAVIMLENDTGQTWPNVQIGYQVGRPYLEAVDYRIESDHPSHDQKSWSLNDADSHPENPAKSNLTSSGRLYMNAFSPGESKRVVITLRAKEYSFGYVDHPDVRGWLWHIDGIYGEQTGWNRDPSNANELGHRIQAYDQLDVFDTDQWMFRGPASEDVEGWSAANSDGELSLNTTERAAALNVTGGRSGLVGPAWTAVDANRFDQLVLDLRSHYGPHTVEISWTSGGSSAGDNHVRFEASGDGEFHQYVVPVGAHSGWTGEVNDLRIEPFISRSAPEGDGWWFDVRSVYFQSREDETTSGRASYASSEPVNLKGIDTSSGAGGSKGSGGDAGTSGDVGQTGHPPSGPDAGGSSNGGGQQTNRTPGTVTTSSGCACTSTRARPSPLAFVMLGVFVLVRLGRRD